MTHPIFFKNVQMLVLSRKQNQMIHIGDDIVIHIRQLKGNTVRIGVEAPEDVRVLRSELNIWNVPEMPTLDSIVDATPPVDS